MANKKPTAAQAQLQLQLYDLRREAKIRQAREWFFANYAPENMEEANRLTPTGSEQSAYARMVMSYWDQACAMLNYGLLHEELFFESTGEFFGVWEQMKPILPAVRTQFGNPQFLGQLEKASLRYEKWISKRSPRWIETMREFRRKMRASKVQGKSA
jgi:hypothetical protein